MSWKMESQEPLIKNKWVEITNERYVVDGVATGDYCIVRKKDYAVIVAVHKGKVAFLRQFRPGLKDLILNLPMGFIEPGEPPEEAAARELEEETGLRTTELVALGKFALAPSFCTFYGHLFLAKNPVKTDTVNPDMMEAGSELVHIPVDEVFSMIEKGTIVDTASALAMLLAKDML